VSYQYVPLEGGIGKGGWANQRATVRYQCAPATAGRIVIADDHEFQRAWVRDLSIKGAGLQLSKPLKPGLFLIIQLKSTNRERSFELPARVAHATPLPAGDFLIGCEFTNPLSQEELDELL